MKHMIQGRANALHVVCGSLFLVCALTHTLFAGTLSDAVPPQFTEDYRSYSSGAVIVRFDVEALEHRSSLPGPRSMHARILAAANDIIPGVTLRRDLTGVMDGLVALHLPAGMGVQAAVKRLNQCDDVVYAEPCYKFRLAGTIPNPPNDPSFGIQWDLNSPSGQLDVDINAPEAWGIITSTADATTGERIMVAVLDTGVDYTHEDLLGNVYLKSDFYYPADANFDDPNSQNYVELGDPNYIGYDHGADFTTTDFPYDLNDLYADGDVVDLNGHGTMVAGIIGAVGNNAVGIAGVAWDVNILPVKVATIDTDTGDIVVTADAALAGIQYAIATGAKVINMSWTMNAPAPFVQSEMENNPDIMFVCAAGESDNGGTDIDGSAVYPAAYARQLPNVISVLATDQTGARWVDLQTGRGSNWGAQSVTIGAPGVAIPSLLPNDGYGTGTGTSFAAPHLSGAIALAMALNPDWTPDKMKHLLSHWNLHNPITNGTRLCQTDSRFDLYKFLQMIRPGRVQLLFNGSEVQSFTSLSAALTMANSFASTSIIPRVVVQSDRWYFEEVRSLPKGHLVNISSGNLDANSYEPSDESPADTFISGYMATYDRGGAEDNLVQWDAGEALSTNPNGLSAGFSGLSLVDGRYAVYMDGSSAVIKNCFIHHNSWGGFYGNETKSVLNSCLIRGHSSSGLTVVGGSDVDINDCTVLNNAAALDGGGLYIADSNALIEDSNFTDNTAIGGAGGAIGALNAQLEITSTIFHQNVTQEWDGGAVWLYGGSASVDHCRFTANESAFDGGGIYAGNQAGLSLTSNVMSGNVADYVGGAVAWYDGANGPVLNNLLLNNISLGYGGAAFYCIDSSPVMANCTFSGNDCEDSDMVGTALLCEGSSQVSLSNSIIAFNLDPAVAQGDASAAVTLDHCLFYRNQRGDYYDPDHGSISLHKPENAAVIGATNLYGDPHFVPGPMSDPGLLGDDGTYYLSQYDAGQLTDVNGVPVDPNVNPGDATSPAVDAGSDLASNLGLSALSTRTDNKIFAIQDGNAVRDAGLVDLGYHYSDAREAELITLVRQVTPISSAGGIKITTQNGTDTVSAYSQIRLEAVEDNSGFVFQSWAISTGNQAPTIITQNPVVLVVSSQVTIVAQYASSTVTLRVNVIGGGGEFVTPKSRQITVPRGTVVNLEVKPDDSRAFVDWDDQADNPDTYARTNTVTMVAPFTKSRVIGGKTEDVMEVTVRFYVPNVYHVQPGGDLQNAIDLAGDLDEVLLNEAYYTLENPLVISKNILITTTAADEPTSVARAIITPKNQNGANQAFRFLGVDPNAILEGVTIQGFNLGGGNGGTPTTEGDPGTAGGTAMGAGIYCNNAAPTIRNVIITGCSVTGGNGGQGADGGTTTNSNGGYGGWPGAGLGGAIALLDSSPTFTNCQISNCTAQGGNGGNSGNPAQGGTLGYPGGLYDHPLLGSQFYADTIDYFALSTGAGGAVYANAGSAPVFTDCDFSGCSVLGGVAGTGQGFRNTINNNYLIDTMGGAVYLGGALYSISGNHIPGPADAGTFANQPATFINCNFVSNTAIQDTSSAAIMDGWTGYGGAMAMITGRDPNLIRCTFTQNSASAGGAVWARRSNLIMDYCQVRQNTAFSGGGAYFEYGSPQILGGLFEANSARVNLLADANSITAGRLLSDVGDGGGLRLQSSNALLQDVQILRNVANRSGGGLYLEGSSSPVIRNCLLTQNSAGRDGGAISVNAQTESFIRNCTLTDNSVSGYVNVDNGYGGGLYVNYMAYAHVIDSIIWANAAATASSQNTGNQIAVDESLGIPAYLEVLNSDIGPAASGGGSGNTTANTDFYQYSTLDPSTRQYVGNYVRDPVTGDRLPSGEPGALYGMGSYVGTDGMDRIIGYSLGNPDDPCDPNAVAFVYTVEIPAGSDADALNPMASRTFTLTDKFLLDVNAFDVGTNCEFYVDAANSVIYWGANLVGIRRYTLDTSVRNLAPNGLSYSYSYDANEVPVLPDNNDFSVSLAYDAANRIWYTESVDPNVPGITQIWTYDDTQGNAGTWQQLFTYEGEAGSIEFVNGYLMLLERSAPVLRYYTPEGILIRTDRGQASASSFTSLGYSALGHYWASDQAGRVLELGLSSQRTRSYGDPILVANGATLMGWDNVNGWTPDTGNIAADPCFVADTFFLTQGQNDPNLLSPCVNTGSADVNDPNVMLDGMYTTNVTGSQDQGIVDMGYHYPLDPHVMVKLSLVVVDQTGAVITNPDEIKGMIQGADQYYPLNTTANLTAVSDPNYRLVMWRGTNNDATTASSNTVLMNQDKVVTVRFGEDVYTLTTNVVGGHGTLSPGSGTVNGGDLVLTATPEEGYRVKRWSGTDTGSSWNQNQVVVNMNADRTVTVQFELDQIKVIKVPEGYPTIQQAINAADEGSTKIVLSQGIHPVPINGNGIDFAGKHIVLSSVKPNDPNVVANTIIDCGGTEYRPSRAFWFHSGEDSDTQILGITIINGFQRGPIGRAGVTPTLPDTPVPLERIDPQDPASPYRNQMGSYAVGDGYGGAVLCESNSSPLFKHCVFQNCVVTGARGGDGAMGIGSNGVVDAGWTWSYIDDQGQTVEDVTDGQWGGHGGAGIGNGYGGAVACRSGSAPTFELCTFRNNTAKGGVGGTGGAGGDARLTAVTPTYDGLQSAGGNAGDGEGSGVGGAIYCDGGSKPLIQDCQFINNVALNAVGGNGGIMGGGNADTTLNPSPGMPGAGYSGGEVVGGAIALADGAEPQMIDCTFNHNKAWDRISAGAVNTGTYLVESQEFYYYDTRGGAIHADSGTKIHLQGSTIRASAGGGVYVASGSSVDINDCVLADNEYILSRPLENPNLSLSQPSVTGSITGTWPIGGGLHLEADVTPAQVRNSYFQGNRTDAAGGGINTASSLTLSNCMFGGNTSQGNGGALIARPSSRSGGLSGGVMYLSDLLAAIGDSVLDAATQALIQDLIAAGTIVDDTQSGTTSQDGTTVTLDMEDCVFMGNRCAYLPDQGAASYSSTIVSTILSTVPGTTTQSAANTSEYSMQYGYGGGVYCKDVDANLTNCHFVNNDAKSGGALFAATSQLDFSGGTVKNNRARGGSGVEDVGLQAATARFGYIRTQDPQGTTDLGGGLVCASTGAMIENIEFIGNTVQGTSGRGGAVDFFGGSVNHVLKNCLFRDNSATQAGGAVSVEIYAQPEIQNCTFVGNQASKVGGGLFVDWTADAAIADSIFQGSTNGAIIEEDSPGVTVNNSLFYQNEKAHYAVFDTSVLETLTLNGSPVTTLGAGNQIADPLFVNGPLGSNYLSQTAAGQTTDSPALNAGSLTAEALALNTQTTATSGELDSGQVDLGYHHVDHTNLPRYALTLQVVHGTGQIEAIPSDPNQQYYAGTFVALQAQPDSGWTVGQWSGTADDSTQARDNYVIMNGPKTVTMAFDQPRVVYAENYRSIQHAIDDVNDGDVVVVPSGNHQPASWYVNEIIILNKAITLTSSNPDDDDVTRSTVIDDSFLWITSSDAVVEGLTFASFGKIYVLDCSPTIRNCYFRDCGRAMALPGTTPEPDDGQNGYSNEGGAIEMYNASPQILNCFFSGCYVIGGDANPGDNGTQQHPDGFDGGWAGWAYGGAVYCGFNSKPDFKDCQFEDCYVRGGNGGNGGNAANPNGIGGRGGNWTWSEGSLETGPFTNPWWSTWDGWQYGDYTADGSSVSVNSEPLDSFRPYWRYTGMGGAVYCESEAAPTFTNCIFNGNRSYGGYSGIGGSWIGADPIDYIPNRRLKIDTFGGSVYATEGCNLTFIGCTFDDSVADNTFADTLSNNDMNEPHDIYYSYGGAVAVEDDSSASFQDCRLNNCQAGVGGAVYMRKAEIQVLDTAVANSVAFHGGGLYLSEATGNIDGLHATGNRAIVDFNTIYDINDPNAVLYDPGMIFGKGGGLFSDASTVDISDSVFKNNLAAGSGGGLYYGGNENSPETFSPRLHNTLITNNTASRDGGGVSVNMYARPVISNSTLAHNTVLGAQGEGAGLGGGLYVAYHSNVKVIDSIIWGNYGVDGAQLSVGASDENGDWSSTVDVNNTTIGPSYDPNLFQHLDEALAAYNAQLAAAAASTSQQVASASNVLIGGDEITQQFSDGADKVPVIVTMKMSTGGDIDWNSPDAVAQRRAAVAAIEAKLTSVVDSTEFETRYHCENIPIVSGEVTAGGLTKLTNNSLIQHVEPVRKVRVALKQALSLGNAKEIREMYPGQGVSIAIVDSGVDYTHPMLGGGSFPNNKVIGGYDFGEMDADPMPGVEPHGTACAGIAAGSLGNYGDYIGGVAYGAKIYALKVSYDDIPSLIDTDASLAAWDWCLTHRNDDPANPIKVISNSWGLSNQPFTTATDGDNYDPAFTSMAKAVTDAGILILAAAGNDGFAGTGISWPAAMSNVMSVGALDDISSEVKNYSNTGTLLDIFAPADPMYTTDIVGAGGYTTGDYYAYFNGTSSACPFVAGSVACLQNSALERLGRYLTPKEVKALLVETGYLISDIKAPTISRPRINLARAITGASAWPISVAKNSRINGWQAAKLMRAVTWLDQWNQGRTVLTDDPLFIGDYYLSQTDSPAINAGHADANDSEVALADKTTSINGDLDMGLVDLGYHHGEGVQVYTIHAGIVYDVNDPNAPHGTLTPEGDINIVAGTQTSQSFTAKPQTGYKVKAWTVTAGSETKMFTGNIIQVTLGSATEINVTVEFEEAASYTLTVKAEGHGTVNPAPGSYSVYDGDTVNLTAIPDNGYEVKSWSGTDNDSTTGTQNAVTVHGSNATVIVTFQEHKYRTLSVGGDNSEYQSIQAAINAARNGDVIVVYPGEYNAGQIADSLFSESIIGLNKSVTVTSTNPSDPATVAQTIIDGGLADAGSPYNYRGVVFGPNAGSGTVLNGFTIQNCGGATDDGDDGQIDDTTGVVHPDGYDGYANGGSAITILPGASPVIKNCVIRDNRAQGGNGGNGIDADDTYNAGRGGWGGWARGGAIYIGPGARPVFKNCSIMDNVAQGGDGGNGGNGNDTNLGNYGGNYSPDTGLNIELSGYTQIDPEIEDPNLWKQWIWDTALSWYVMFENRTDLTATDPLYYIGPPRWYSAYGGGVFCGENSVVTFVDCTISGNRTYGGLTGLGGSVNANTRPFEPLVNYEIDSYGGGVYCAQGSSVQFDGCTLSDNQTSADDITRTITDIYQWDAFTGHGGGVCAELNASVVFNGCTFQQNQADEGGAVLASKCVGEVRGSNVTDNAAQQGAGLALINSDMDVMDCNIVANVALVNLVDVNDPNDNTETPYGAGLYLSHSSSMVMDCNFTGNLSLGSGGAVYLVGPGNPVLLNCLFHYNGALQNGGAIAASLYTAPILQNCTLVYNRAYGYRGDPDATGFGGALYMDYGSIVEAYDSIFWRNGGVLGREIALLGEDGDTTSCARLNLSHCDLYVDDNDVYVKTICDERLTYGAGMIHTDPMFTNGDRGDFYLAGASPCIDAGSDYAGDLGMVYRTTRYDNRADAGLVDLGYHYKIVQSCRFCDLTSATFDGLVNFRDFAVVAANWGASVAPSNGTERNDQGDLSLNQSVDLFDLALMSHCWLALDNQAPIPNPPQWSQTPHRTDDTSVMMSAQAATDVWGGPVEYYFQCVNGGGDNSGWQSSPTYSVGGLSATQNYNYRFRTRDERLNVSQWSNDVTVYDASCYAPTGTLALDVNAVDVTTLSVIGGYLSHDSGVQYRFVITEANNADVNDSGWLDFAEGTRPWVTFTQLHPSKTYKVRYQARSLCGNLPTTAWSEPVVATTDVSTDLTPPDPNPMTWSDVVDVNGWDGRPHMVKLTTDDHGYWIEMTATDAVDDSGGVVYYQFRIFNYDDRFIEISDWTTDTLYRYGSAFLGQLSYYRCQVRARDEFWNVTQWSDIDPVTFIGIVLPYGQFPSDLAAANAGNAGNAANAGNAGNVGAGG